MTDLTIRHMYCMKCNTFTPHIIKAVGIIEGKVKIETHCLTHNTDKNPEKLETEETISALLYEAVIEDDALRH